MSIRRKLTLGLDQPDHQAVAARLDLHRVLRRNGSLPGTGWPAYGNARLDLARAQSEVRAAADRRALWATAVSAFETAQAAFERTDCAGVKRPAHTAADQACSDIAQTPYPLFPPPNPGGSR